MECFWLCRTLSFFSLCLLKLFILPAWKDVWLELRSFLLTHNSKVSFINDPTFLFHFELFLCIPPHLLKAIMFPLWMDYFWLCRILPFFSLCFLKVFILLGWKEALLEHTTFLLSHNLKVSFINGPAFLFQFKLFLCIPPYPLKATMFTLQMDYFWLRRILSLVFLYLLKVFILPIWEEA